LKENPKSRPNIYQVLREACLMQGIEVPIKDVSLYLESSDRHL
jgi:AP2-associated kinase